MERVPDNVGGVMTKDVVTVAPERDLTRRVLDDPNLLAARSGTGHVRAGRDH